MWNIFQFIILKYKKNVNIIKMYLHIKQIHSGTNKYFKNVLENFCYKIYNIEVLWNIMRKWYSELLTDDDWESMNFHDVVYVSLLS